jgi:hypothetical protein
MGEVINGRGWVAFQNSFILPSLKELGDRGIGIGLLIEIQADEVVGGLAVEFLLLLL